MTKLRPISRDGFPSVGEALAAQEVAREAVAPVSAATALAWATANKIRLPPRGRAAAINYARQEAGLPMFVIDPRLTDPALPPVRSNARGAIVIGRARSERVAGSARESGIPTVLQKALLAWWSVHNQGTADERAATTAYLREALEPHIAGLQAAVGQS